MHRFGGDIRCNGRGQKGSYEYAEDIGCNRYRNGREKQNDLGRKSLLRQVSVQRPERPRGRVQRLELGPGALGQVPQEVDRPDGRLLAYVSDETGRPEVYLRPLSAEGKRIAVSTSGGSEPVWSRTGDELFFRSGRRLLSGLLSVAVIVGAVADGIVNRRGPRDAGVHHGATDTGVHSRRGAGSHSAGSRFRDVVLIYGAAAVFVHPVARSVVRGVKAQICGVAAANEIVVLPGTAYGEEDRAYAVAFAVPRDTKLSWSYDRTAGTLSSGWI